MLNGLKTIYRAHSKEIWYLTIIVLIFVSRKTIFNVSREIGKFDATLDSGTSLLMVGVMMSLVAIWKNRGDFSDVRKANFSFMAYYILCLSSFLWAGHFGTIVFKAVEVLCCFGVVGIIMNKMESLRQGLYYIIFLSTLITYISVSGALLKYGIFVHTNTYSMSAMVGLLLCLGVVRFDIFGFNEVKYYILLNTLALIGGTSSASWVSFIIGVIILYSMNENGVGLLRTAAVCVIIYAAYELALDQISDIIFKGKTKEMVESGHGRDVIWNAAIASWKDSPWLGSGFLVGERSLGNYGLGLKVISVHNTFLSVLVGTGIAGMVLFVNFLFKWIGRLLAYIKYNRYATILFPVVIATVVNCMAFPAIGSDWNFVAPVVYALITFVFLHIDERSDMEEEYLEEQEDLL